MKRLLFLSCALLLLGMNNLQAQNMPTTMRGEAGKKYGTFRNEEKRGDMRRDKWYHHKKEYAQGNKGTVKVGGKNVSGLEVKKASEFQAA